MRILITTSFLSEGSGLSVYIFTLCKIFSGKHTIDVITTHNGVDTSFERKTLYDIDPNIKLFSLGGTSKLKKYIGVLRQIRRFKPDVIVNNYNAVVQRLLPFIGNHVKNIHVIHSITEDFYRIAAINGKKVDYWIAPTQAIVDEFNEYTEHKFDSRVKLIPHGVIETECSLREKKSPIEIVYTGVLYPHKGIQHLPEIYKLLKERDLKFHLTIIGDGKFRDDLKKALSEGINAGEIAMTGNIPHAEVYEKMSKGDIFLYPTNCDAFGLVIAEAMMNGLVPVVGHLPGITDNLVTDGKNGYLVSPHDSKTYAERIICLAESPMLLRDMRVRAVETAKTRLSYSVMYQNYINFIESLSTYSKQ